jgi:multimeric flavodoxin WrbA
MRAITDGKAQRARMAFAVDLHMTTVILSAASPELPALQALQEVLKAELRHAGESDESVRTFDLASIKLGYCQGEFDCWLKTPGTCRTRDAEQEIVRAIHDADKLVLLDAVTFGGPSYTVKRAQDRMICLLLPFFVTRSELTHHRARYDSPPSLFLLGWQPAHEAQEAHTWHAFADAVAVDMLAPRVGSAVVDDGGRDTWTAAVRGMLNSNARPGAQIHGRKELHEQLLEAARPSALPHPLTPIKSAALLVGSAKVKGTSASETLAHALAARLHAVGIETQLHFATEFLHEASAGPAAQAVSAADLFVLVTPLYVDALPALATHALETIAKHRAHKSGFDRFALLVNCGFPEPEQTRTAVRIARHFAGNAGYHWAGALPLGGGGMVNPKVPLDDQHGPAEHIKHALDLAAAALARGDNVPTAALEAMIKPPLPDVLYRLVGNLGWRYQAYRSHMHQNELSARPLE